VSDTLGVEVWRAPTPLPKPVMTAAGPFDTFFHVVVVIHDDDLQGWGYSGLASGPELDRAADRAVRLLSARPSTLDALLTVEHFEQAWGAAPSDTAGKAAANAIAVAAWDLAARRLGVACADLWGRRPGTEALDCYASGIFLDASLGDVRDEAAAYRAAGYRLVKMRTGLPLDADLERFESVRAAFSEPGSIAVDAFHAWRPEQALAFVARAGAPLLWVEDPTPYAELAAVSTASAPVAAGESLETLADLSDLRAGARVDYALLDVQRLGGPMRFLAIASALAAAGARIGAHVYTSISAHLLACVDNPLPVEVFDWSDPLMEAPPAPGADGRLPVGGPGFGIGLRRRTLDRFGQRVA
jgi:L-alanine-DL-glutamate epimerase-like enolase superfamily enzyme